MTDLGSCMEVTNHCIVPLKRIQLCVNELELKYELKKHPHQMFFYTTVNAYTEETDLQDFQESYPHYFTE